MIKKLYILWCQGFDKAPEIVQLCRNSWYKHNPDWEIIEVTDENMQSLVDMKEIYGDLSAKTIAYAAYSDMFRIALLQKHGGLWVDATTYCILPLSSWLPKYINAGFFGFSNPGSDRLLSSWFLYSEKGGYIASKWLAAVQEYWSTRNKCHMYYWFHGFLFGNLYKSDSTFKHTWGLVPKYSADTPHYLHLKYGMLKTLTPEGQQHIDTIAPLYKLTYKLKPHNVLHIPGHALTYLFSK